uniref:FYVE-type domain-containing protein n=1 Tax=Peronospora matthiolae TaxID=2874970 RepID=A0AAV1TN37_9STRA
MRDEVQGVNDHCNKAPNHKRAPVPEDGAGPSQYALPFTLSREDEAIGMQLARTHLTQLMTECAASKSESQLESAWMRVNKTKKHSAEVICWEKYAGKTTQELQGKARGSSVPSRLAALTLKRESGSASYSVRSSTTVHAPLNAVLRALDASVATAHRSFTRIIYGNLVADTSVLFHSSTPRTDFLAEDENDSAETLAVRWIMCRCSNPTVYDCDFCLQEYTKWHSRDELTMFSNHCKDQQPQSDDAEPKHDGTDRSCGHDGLHALEAMPAAYKLFRSVETRHCPDLLDSHRVVRCKVPLGGFLLYPTASSDKTDVVFYMTIARDAASNCNKRGRNSVSSNAGLTQCSDRQFHALQNVARQMALHIGRLNNAVDSYSMILHLESLHTLQWVRNAERLQCAVCCRRFHQLTRRRHHCRLCGEVICRRCSVKKDLHLPTSGPAMLRICTSCNQASAPSRPKSSSRNDAEVQVASQKLQSCRGVIDHASGNSVLDSIATFSFSEPPLRRSSRSLSEELTGSVMDESATESCDEAERMFFVVTSEGAQRIDTSEMRATSCLQSELSPASDRRHFAWTRRGCKMLPTMKSPPVTTAPDTLDTAQPSKSKVGRHLSSSETFPASPNQPSSSLPHKRCRVRATTRNSVKTDVTGSGINDKEGEVKVEDSTSRTDDNESDLSILKSQHSSLSTRAQQIWPVKNGICTDNSDGNHEPLFTMTDICTLIRLHNRPWTHRSFEMPRMYEDVFLKLCETAASVRNSQFVALTLFMHTTQQDESPQNEVEAAEATVSYLKVRGCAKLMTITANLRCCDPVLQLQRPIVTRDTWALDESADHPSGYDFRQLPIVVGSQQARFYAGVPLMNTEMHCRYGALAVFDSETSPGEDDDLPMKKTLQALQMCAEEAMMAAEKRQKEIQLQTFSQASLIPLRRSESVLRPSVDIQQSDPQQQDIESIDRDSADDDGIDEDYQRDEHVVATTNTKGAPEFTNSGTSSVGKARVDYFRNKLRQLVQQAQDTQAQMMENTLVMERHRVPIV